MIIFLMFEACRFFWLIRFIVLFRNSFQIIQADESEGKPPSLEGWLIATLPLQGLVVLQGHRCESPQQEPSPNRNFYQTAPSLWYWWSVPEKPLVRAFNLLLNQDVTLNPSEEER